MNGCMQNLLCWSHCFAEKQKFTEQLTGSSLCNFLQELRVFLKCESCCLQGEILSALCCHHVILYSLGWFPCFFPLHTPSWSTGANAQGFSFLHWQSRAEPFCLATYCTVT